MKRIQSFLCSICLFLTAVLIAALADAGSIQVISQHGKWFVDRDCLSVHASNISDPSSEGFRAGLEIGSNNGDYGIPDIRVYLAGDLKLGKKTQFKFKLANNDLASEDWICEKYDCSPKDKDSAAKILEQLLANEGPLTVIATDKNKTVQATIDTTGINEAYQTLLKHRM